jgi:hypothetical protein
MRQAFIIAAAIGALLCATPAGAEVIHYAASLNGAAETPPNTSTGAGTAKINLDTTAKTVSWTLTYSGLSGPAVAAHFHGPAPAGKAAGVEVPVIGPFASPIAGTASLSDTQAAELRAGQWYLNVHTAAHPAGEIRGQVLPAN